MRLCDKIWNFDECPAFLRRARLDPTPLNRLREVIRGRQFGHWPMAVRNLLRLYYTCIWPVRAAFLAARSLGRYGSRVKQLTGKTELNQAFEVVALALQHSVAAPAYYQYELFRPENWQRVEDYLFQGESDFFAHWLNRGQLHPATQNKHVFSQLMLRHGLPGLPTLALYHEGRNAQGVFAPEGSFFVKPVHGARGDSCLAWVQIGPGQFTRQDHGALQSWTEIEVELKAHSLRRALLVQARQSSHPQLSGICPGSLGTVRYVTGRLPEGEIVHIAATLKLPWRFHEVTNNLSLISAVELESGVLGKAWSYQPLCPGYGHHPITKFPIAGLQLPDWTKVTDLATKAHQLLTNHVFLGWDIALTDAGPVLLECNAGWDVLTVQKPQMRPLGTTPFSLVCEAWLKNPNPPALNA
ncbi:hypothetical protein JST97_19030 [bacterium]|nr:hypothetical protein [bacterium]